MSVIPLAEQAASGQGRATGSAKEIVYLPVAPQLTAKTRFSSAHPKKVDFLMPHDAIIMLDQIMKVLADKVFMVAICGPGDPLAVPDTSIKTIRLVRSRYPQVQIGLKTLGIGSERFAAALAEAGVDYVEMEVNGVKPEILEKIYAWIRPGQKTLKISEAARLMVSEQKNGVSALKFNNISVSITTTLFPGYNGGHIGHIARFMRELGADSMSVIPYEPDPEAEVMLASPEPEIVKTGNRDRCFSSEMCRASVERNRM